MQEAVINSTGAIRYTAVLTPDNLDPTPGAVPNTNMPSPHYASDIIYGGLGNDALHGGAGDDAMSGAEAPTMSYTNNYSHDRHAAERGADSRATSRIRTTRATSSATARR